MSVNIWGGFGHGYVQTGLGAAEYRKWPVANLTVGPCSLGCQQLGLCCYASDGSIFVHSHLALDRITSCPALLPHSLGENDSPKPFL